ncbi:MAG TPA: hypothetical protein ENH82_06515 [bacterium]|nr:hypothetical protein [bacterium]
MLYKIHAKSIIKKGIPLNRNNIKQIGSRVTELLSAKGSCQVIFAGGPGSGKSTLARVIKQKGFLNISKKQLVIIDDLQGPDNKKFKKKELPLLVGAYKNRVLLLFDYKAALYLKNADIGIIIVVTEEERLRNLKKRSTWGYKKYKKRFYRIPPVPFTYKQSDTYVCSGNILDIFGYENENPY